MNNNIIVNKFGGGILKKKFIPLMIERLNEQIGNRYQPIVVVSALPGITDQIVQFLNAKKFSKEINKKFIKNLTEKHNQVILEIGIEDITKEKIKIELDRLFTNMEKDLVLARTVLASEDKIISYGEKLSATIFVEYLNSNNLSAKRILAEEIPIITDDNFKDANIVFKISEKNIKNKISKIKEIPVIPGFTGITKDGIITTLGRGGTDTTACFIGSALRAHKVILWKDVDGVLSADPKIVKEAKTIPTISYQEAEEAGKIIHEKAIQYPKMFGTPIEIASIANPNSKTKIEPKENKQKGAKIVSYKKDLTLFLITDEVIKGNELLSMVSDVFLKNKVDILLISNTRYSLQIVSENNNNVAEKVLAELKKKVFKVETHPVSMVFLVGNFDVAYVNDFNSLLIKMKTDLEISAFLYKNCTRLEAVIRTDKIENIIRALYKKFII
ncbi:MAG: aspartate kinase [Candidatus Paceibacterota bacterium]